MSVLKLIHTFNCIPVEIPQVFLMQDKLILSLYENMLLRIAMKVLLRKNEGV